MLLVWLFNKRAYPELTLNSGISISLILKFYAESAHFWGNPKNTFLCSCPLLSARRSRLSCPLPLAVHSTSATGTRRKRAVTPSFDYRSWLAQPCLSHQSENVKVKKG